MSKWVNNIPKKFREMLTSNDNVTEELIDMVINQLREMYKFKYADELIDSIDETREHFEFLKDLINGPFQKMTGVIMNSMGIFKNGLMITYMNFGTFVIRMLVKNTI